MVRQKKKSAQKKKPPGDPFSKLTWEDLEEWAGAVIVARGRPYQRNGAVGDLGRTEDGTLLAWVMGTRRYATWVRLTERNGLESACTCPYWNICKHAVAVVLEYLERLKTDSAIGQIEEDDPRLLELGAIEDEYDEYEEFTGEEEEENVKARSGHSKSKKSKTASLHPYLQEQTKAELVALVVELADAHDEVRQLLADRCTLASGQTHKILQTIRREIRALEEPVWDEYEYRDSEANVDRLKAALKGLIEAGQARRGVATGAGTTIREQSSTPVRARRRVRRRARRLPQCPFSSLGKVFSVAGRPDRMGSRYGTGRRIQPVRRWTGPLVEKTLRQKRLVRGERPASAASRSDRAC